jgi:hypothetical protein
VLRYTQVSLEDLPKWAPAFVRNWKKNGWKGVFTTTLHVLNSAIIKLSKTTKAFRVFRGTKGGVLPKKFWQPNDMNVRGGIECGFMSTTLKREVALNFAASDDKPSLLFEIQMGMVDRGAPVKWCSQFPGEEEILFNPLCGLEVVGKPRVEGRTMVVELRLNCNLHDMTIEQLTAKMKVTHISLVNTIKLDLQMQGFTPDQLGPIIDHEAEYAQKDGPWFSDADHYKDATNHALDSKLEAMASAMSSSNSATSSSSKTKTAAADVLFKAGDSAALALAVVKLLRDENLRVEYGERLSKAAADAAEYSELRLDLKDLGLTGELPDDVISLLLAAERFDISGNQFSNVAAESMRYEMIYKCSCMQKWREGDTLNLSAQNLTDESMATLGSLLPLIIGLRELDLSSNTITAAGAKAVADGVANCR